MKKCWSSISSASRGEPLVDTAYIKHSLAAALGIARFDPNAIDHFDTSYGGFFRSFFAMIVASPCFVFMALVDRRIELNVAALGHRQPLPVDGFYFLETIYYIVDWMALPLLMIPVAKLIGVGGRYVPFVVAYNWCNCVVYAALLIPSVLDLSGLLPQIGRAHV